MQRSCFRNRHACGSYALAKIKSLNNSVWRLACYNQRSVFWGGECFMVRAVIVGSGTCVPPNQVTNDMLSRIMDATDEWIKERSGVETRYYVDEGISTSDLGLAAATEALRIAGVDKN